MRTSLKEKVGHQLSKSNMLSNPSGDSDSRTARFLMSELESVSDSVVGISLLQTCVHIYGPKSLEVYALWTKLKTR